jgi:Uncharacterized protein conserved in archaea
MIYSVTVTVRAPVRDTEVADRVGEAIKNIFPAAEPVEHDGNLRATVHDLDRFSELLHQREITSAAHERLIATIQEDSFSFQIKKQAALESVVTFAVGDPNELGTIAVDVEVADPDPAAFIEHIAPSDTDANDS